MAALSNPVNATNIFSRFRDYVYATAVAGVVYGTDFPLRQVVGPTRVRIGGSSRRPIYGYVYTNVIVIPATEFGGISGRRPSDMSIIDNSGDPGSAQTDAPFAANPITASSIVNTLSSYTSEYCKIRRVRGDLNVTGPGGNAGTRPSPGVVFTETGVGYLNTNAKQGAMTAFAAPPVGSNVKDLTINFTNLENYISSCRNAYNTYARNQTYVYTTNVCHASCHSSCHFARGRR
jgi:hypothetical protein